MGQGQAAADHDLLCALRGAAAGGGLLLLGALRPLRPRPDDHLEAACDQKASWSATWARPASVVGPGALAALPRWRWRWRWRWWGAQAVRCQRRRRAVWRARQVDLCGVQAGYG